MDLSTRQRRLLDRSEYAPLWDFSFSPDGKWIAHDWSATLHTSIIKLGRSHRHLTRHTLVDGGLTTQPEFSFWFKDIGWQVENYGVDPDIEVEYRPQDYVAGVDPQLRAAWMS